MSRSPNIAARLLHIVNTWLQDILAEREHISARAAKYDQLKETISSLRDALATHSRTIEDLAAKVESLEKRNSILQAEYKVLQNELEQKKADYGQALLLQLFSHAKSALVQLPTLKHAVGNGALPTVLDVLSVVSPLETAFVEVGFEAIGKPGEIVKFDPVMHTLVTAAHHSNSQIDRTRVRYVGYMLSGNIVCKAEVGMLEQEDNPITH